eukprot:scaffold162697_cov29-Tisochrysis_lutea.AAC.1
MVIERFSPCATCYIVHRTQAHRAQARGAVSHVSRRVPRWCPTARPPVLSHSASPSGVPQRVP